MNGTTVSSARTLTESIDSASGVDAPKRIRATTLPFPALVGMELAQQAMLLLAVEPKLRGIVIAAAAGTGKSSLARGIQHLLLAASSDESVPPFVEVPTSADIENLLGGLDLEATLHAGRTVVRSGLLAQADGGTVYVDGLNLLMDASANLLLSVLDEGEVRVEREGLSLRAAARFSLIGSYDPAEGLPRNHLLDRVGLLINLNQMPTAVERSAVIRHNLLTPDSAWQEENEILFGLMQAAREILPSVTMTPEQMMQLSQSALAYGVSGHRVDLFAIHAACAAAALNLRHEVDASDLELAARLVVLPRATQVPTENEPPPQQSIEQSAEQSSEPPSNTQSEQQQPQTESQEVDPTEQPKAADETKDARSKPPPEPPSESPLEEGAAVPEEQILAALASELPTDLDELPFRTVQRGRAGSRGATEGTRGRHVRSLPGDPKRWRLDASATLRAAAPWQSVRRTARAGQEVNTTQSSFRETMANILTRPGSYLTRALSNTRVLSNIWAPSKVEREQPDKSGGRNESKKLYFESGDIRVKHYRSKAGALFCFAVDASGSMALHRMGQAKGAIHSLLEKAYVKRDRVALIAFRGNEAEVLMPPTQSVELAKRALDLLPTGGGTPLASALLLGHEMAQQAQMRGIHQTVFVLLTDGRGNVPLNADPTVTDKKVASRLARAELEQIAFVVAQSNLHVVVVDTQRSFLSKGEAKQLAGWLGGDYLYLPSGSSEEIAAAAAGAVEG